jgi:hypothetical protein
MKVVNPGRMYELSAGNRLAFLQKGRERIIREGTTNEEVLEVLIDRVTEAYQSLPCEESIRALYLLQEALAAFRMRTERRIAAGVEGTHQPHEYLFESEAALPGRTMATEVEVIDYGPN